MPRKALRQRHGMAVSTEHYLRAVLELREERGYARVVDIAGAAHRLFIVRDITERRERVREIERLSRLAQNSVSIDSASFHASKRTEICDLRLT